MKNTVDPDFPSQGKKAKYGKASHCMTPATVHNSLEQTKLTTESPGWEASILTDI